MVIRGFIILSGGKFIKEKLFMIYNLLNNKEKYNEF